MLSVKFRYENVRRNRFRCRGRPAHHCRPPRPTHSAITKAAWERQGASRRPAEKLQCQSGKTIRLNLFAQNVTIFMFAIFRSQMTPVGSRTNSRPSSRPASRAGSKPPSRHGSTLSLDSTDDATPSRIPTRRITNTSTPRPSRLSVGSSTVSRTAGTTTTTNGVSSRTASGAASPAPTR